MHDVELVRFCILKFGIVIFVGSCVEIFYRNELRCGVVKWIGNNNESIQSNRLVAVEIVSKISTKTSVAKSKLHSQIEIGISSLIFMG